MWVFDVWSPTTRRSHQLAAELDGLNQTRREIEQGMVADAEMILTQITPAPDEMGIAVYHEGFHQGVVGIVAGRLREKFHRPVLCLPMRRTPQTS